jgi:cytochrome c biogenesis protein CcmG/thiol:disulfide interchange protein DsbE
VTALAVPNQPDILAHADPSDPGQPGLDSQSLKTGRRKGGRRLIRWIALATGVMAVFIIFALAVAPPSTQSEVNSPLVGHRAPAIAGTEITGSPFDLGTLRGHFLVIDFFASWCVPCRTEQPELVRFAEHQDNGARLVGVIFEDPTSAIRSLLGPWIGLYPVVTDPGGRIALNYGVYNPPSKYVIDPEGTVVAKIIGPVTAAGLDSVVARAKAQGL